MKTFKKIKSLFRKKKSSAAEVPYWEYYNRYFFVAQKIKELGPSNQILDVGGIKSSQIFEKFGIKNVKTLNISGDADVLASCQNLPFKDGAFEVATCIDTLEHVPQEIRDVTVVELIRVAKKAVFVVAPVNSKENMQAEDIVYKHLKSGYIEEHRKMGLVDFDSIKAAIKDNPKINFVKEDMLDDLMYWTALMVGDKIEPSQLYQELYFLENRFCPRRKALSIYLK